MLLIETTRKWVQFGVIVMTKLIKAFLRDERGAAAAEYALILAVIGGGIVAGATLLGGNIANVLNAVAAKIVMP